MKANWLCIALAVSLLSACNLTKQSDKRIDKSNASLVETKDERLQQIGKFSYGTDIALQSSNVPVAKITNDRVMALSDKPSLNDMKELQTMVRQLTTNNLEILNRYDNDVNRLQTTITKLENKLQSETESRLAQARTDADELNRYKAWFGLGGLFMSLKRIFFWLVIFGIVYLVLRVASTVNPVAGAAFGIFDGVFGLLTKGIHLLAPKAISAAGFVSDKYKATVEKVVDSVETIKATETASGRAATTKELLEQLSKSMGDKEKALVK